LIIGKIYYSIKTITKIKLHVFAFRAYANDRQTPLQRPRIELLDEINILKLMEKKPVELGGLLREKLGQSTVIENKSLKVMHAIVNDKTKNQDIMACFKTDYFKKQLSNCVDVSSELIELRKAASHNKEIGELYDDFVRVLTIIIGEIEKC
jgi:hypothetical protein